MHMGTPLSCLQPHIGKPIRNHPNCAQLAVDPHGFNVALIKGIKGGDVQGNHNGICRTLSEGLTNAGIPHTGGATDTGPKAVFRGAIPQNLPPNDANDNKINSIIADLVVNLNNSATEPLGGAKHLVDVKTLGPGQSHHLATTSFADAVKNKAKQVDREYNKTADSLDARLHRTLAEEKGPFAKILREYNNGKVVVPVVDFFGATSEDMIHLRDAIAHELARSHIDLYRTPAAQAIGLHKQMLNRLWGHIFARGWARLILNRVRDHKETETITDEATSQNSTKNSSSTTQTSELEPSEYRGPFSTTFPNS